MFIIQLQKDNFVHVKQFQANILEILYLKIIYYSNKRGANTREIAHAPRTQGLQCRGRKACGAEDEDDRLAVPRTPGVRQARVSRNLSCLYLIPQYYISHLHFQ